MNFPYTLTPSAKAFILEEARALGVSACLRAWVEGGGCSGLKYGLDFSEIQADDLVQQDGAVTLVCDPLSAMYLDQASLDGQDDVEGRRLVWRHPGARHTCSCGQSFTAEMP